MAETRRLDAYHFYEREWDSYDDLLEAFEWEIPETFNIAEYVCDRWADDKGRVMLFADGAERDPETYTFWQAKRITDRLAGALAENGVERGDRVGVLSTQRPETLFTHIAAWKLGAVSIPLSTLFGPDALEHRLGDAAATACIVVASSLESLRNARDSLDGLEDVLVIGEADLEAGERDFWTTIEESTREQDAVEVAHDDPAVIYYTSGSTGQPKGCLHDSDHLLGILPQFQVGIAGMQVEPSDLYWSPSDWAWGGAFALHTLPALFYGRPSLAYDAQFDPELTFEIFEEYGVSHSFLAPTAIRMMQHVEDANERFDLSEIEVIWMGGEDVGQSIIDWTASVFPDARVHSSYGQTEAVGVLCNATVSGFREGSTGRTTPGHDVRILDPETVEPLEPNEEGEIGVRIEGDPLVFTEYWNRPDATAETKKNGFLRTGDLGVADEDGYFSFIGRKDDVIISSGYRIGPEEIENAVADHDAVEDAGVIGVSHDERGTVPKAFVKLAEGVAPGEDLRSELQAFVGDNLSKHEYPRELEFVDELPMTVTGKIQRYKLHEREEREES